jgi:hypothetical protein
VQTVAELHSFRRHAEAAGMQEEEIAVLISYLAENPKAGDEIQGTGGCRKLRWARRGKGKSGGYRAITFFTGEEMPLFLVTAFGKGEKANLTQAERNALRTLTKQIAREYAE